MWWPPNLALLKNKAAQGCPRAAPYDYLRSLLHAGIDVIVVANVEASVDRVNDANAFDYGLEHEHRLIAHFVGALTNQAITKAFFIRLIT